MQVHENEVLFSKIFEIWFYIFRALTGSFGECNYYVFKLSTLISDKISHFLRSSSQKKFLKLKKLINKILYPYSFLCLEWMAFKKEKILAPFL